MIDTINAFGTSTLGARLAHGVGAGPHRRACVVPLLGCVAYLTLWERKAIGWSQIRPGPNRVGPLGLLQPIADAREADLQGDHRSDGRRTRACSSSAR